MKQLRDRPNISPVSKQLIANKARSGNIVESLYQDKFSRKETKEKEQEKV
jgi:hypothetical protein